VQVRVPAAVGGDVAHVAGDRLPGLVVHGHGRVAAGEVHAHRRHAVEPGPAAPVVRVHLAGEQVHPVVHALGGGVDVLEVGGQVQVGIDLPLAAQGDVGGHRVAPVHARGGGHQGVVEGAVLELAVGVEAERIGEGAVAGDVRGDEAPAVAGPVHQVLGVVVEVAGADAVLAVAELVVRAQRG